MFQNDGFELGGQVRRRFERRTRNIFDFDHKFAGIHTRNKFALYERRKRQGDEKQSGDRYKQPARSIERLRQPVDVFVFDIFLPASETREEGETYQIFLKRRRPLQRGEHRHERQSDEQAHE